jgi:Leucine-rich repeat (LRR) protein
MQRRWMLAAGAVIAAAAAVAYLQWMHDWRPGCRNAPAAAEAAAWLNEITRSGEPFKAEFVACIEVAAFYGRGRTGDRNLYAHPGIGVHVTARPRAEDFAKLKGLPRLAAIDLLLDHADAGYDDVLAGSLSQIRTLREIKWHFGRGLTDAGARRLGDLPNLELLQLEGATLGAGLQAWARLSKLRRLWLRDSTLTADGVAALEKLRALEELWIAFGRVEGTLAPLARMPALGRLQLIAVKIDDGQIGTLAGAPALEYLELDVDAIGPRGLAGVAKLPKLAGLRIRKAEVTGGLELLAAAPALRSVSLHEAKLDDAPASGLAALKSLERISLQGSTIGDATAAALAALPALEELDLEETPITDAALRALAAAPRLRKLAVSGTAVTDDGLALLARYPRLVEAIAYRTRATAAGFAKLKAAKPSLTVRGE